MANAKAIDLSQHIAITSAPMVSKIVKPLTKAFSIKHYRYLKLYNDGSRILLSNYPDCTRFIYEEGHYKKMWFDGEFPEQLVEGWHIWDIMRTINCGGEMSPFEKEINHNLNLYHGLTYIAKGINFYEIFTFDSEHDSIYQINYGLLKHFIMYFKEQAKALIKSSEREKIIIATNRYLLQHSHNQYEADIAEFLTNTRINRYYLNGCYDGIYLTDKEAQCAFWLIKGKSADEIAMIQNNSMRTIESHLDNIRRKLNCSKQTQMIRILLEIGFPTYYQSFNKRV